MLNTKKALQLAEWLSPHIPEEVGSDILDFIGTIVKSLIDSDGNEIFARSVMLMGDSSVDEINNMTGEEIVSKFVDGLMENHIITLIEFHQWLMK
jgi:hypothetical protein